MIYQENKNRRVFNIDYDGTLTTGEYTVDPGPNQAVIDRVRDLYCSGHIIIIWTARWWENAPDMVSWLIKHRVPFHGVMMGKGGSDAYVDDKAVSWGDVEVQEWR
jgi:hypothetical protein